MDTIKHVYSAFWDSTKIEDDVDVEIDPKYQECLLVRFTSNLSI